MFIFPSELRGRTTNIKQPVEKPPLDSDYISHVHGWMLSVPERSEGTEVMKIAIRSDKCFGVAGMREKCFGVAGIVR